MTLTQVNSEAGPYEFCRGLQFLLEKFDPSDNAVTTCRAIELQAFRVALFYPKIYRLTASGKPRRPLIDMVALARKHAALALYKRYTARSPGPRGQSLKSIEENLSGHFDSLQVVLEILKEYIRNNQDASNSGHDLTPQEYTIELQRVFIISKSVANIIEVYRSNGVDLHSKDDCKSSLRIMIDCLCDAGLLKKSEKTLDNYFKTLEPVAVFHYLYWLQGCKDVLAPDKPNSSEFVESILTRGCSVKYVDELRDVCNSYNIIAHGFNDLYRFSFPIIRNVPRAETETHYNSISPTDYNPKLTPFISKRPFSSADLG